MTSVTPSSVTGQTVELAPSYKIPLVLILAAIPIAWLQLWVGLAISVFGLFLMIQTVTIRLQFTETALDVYRSGKLIRNFPYAEWLNWRIFGIRFLFCFILGKSKAFTFCQSFSMRKP